MDHYLQIPDLKTAKRVLAIQPHYDDNDIAAGGTLAALAEGKTEIYYLTVTNDLVGVLDQTLTDEQAAAQLRTEQHQAGSIIGVDGLYWLGYPDAGKYDYFDVRRDIIQHIRIIKPDFIFTCDPWTPYEAHRDHIQTGLAAAEAAILYSLKRLTTIPQVDSAYTPHKLHGVVFYASSNPNTIFDISRTINKKNLALDSYQAQFAPAELSMLKQLLTYKAEQYAADQPFDFGEPLKILHPAHLHVYPEAWKT